MLDALLALTLFAASAPKVAYKPNPAATADVATVVLEVPRRNACFGIVRVSMLLSVNKADGARAYVVSVTVADSITPGVITDGALGGTAVRTVNVRNGDVACTDYQCPTGSAAIFELSQAQREALSAAGSLPLLVKARAGNPCTVEMPIDKANLAALDAWAGKLAPAR